MLWGVPKDVVVVVVVVVVVPWFVMAWADALGSLGIDVRVKLPRLDSSLNEGMNQIVLFLLQPAAPPFTKLHKRQTTKRASIFVMESNTTLLLQHHSRLHS